MVSLRRGACLLVAALGALAGCGESSETAGTQAPPAQSEAVPVGVIVVRPQPVTIGENFVGRIEAVAKVDVRARVRGFIEARHFEEGQNVEPGAPLFRIERGTYEAVVEERRANLAAAEAQAQNAQVQLRRARELERSNNVSRAVVDEREAAARATQAEVMQSQAALRQAEIDLGYTEIVAPVGGRTGRAQFNVGALVEPASPPLVQIVSQDPVYVVFPVSQRRLLEAERAAREKGQTASDFVVRVHFEDGTVYPHPGRVDFVGNTVERGTDTVSVRAVLANPDGLLRDGQFANVVIEPTEPAQALVIPQAAIQADQQGQFVLTVDAANTVAVRRIQQGEVLERGQVTVTSGIEDGDKVVVQGLQKVRPGMPVDPRPVDMAGGA